MRAANTITQWTPTPGSFMSELILNISGFPFGFWTGGGILPPIWGEPRGAGGQIGKV